ncbi:MAG: transcription antitermination factor NusB [Desulfuromonadales bacterium]
MSRGIRRQGREMALKVLYSLADHEGGSLDHVLQDFWKNFQFRNDVLGEAIEDEALPPQPEVRSFAERLICGVAENLEPIDRELNSYSTNWALDRMARVDLALLRLAAYELMYCPDVPHSVVINEAIEIGKRFGSEETPAFINGLLDHLSHQHRAAPK